MDPKLRNVAVYIYIYICITALVTPAEIYKDFCEDKMQCYYAIQEKFDTNFNS